MILIVSLFVWLEYGGNEIKVRIEIRDIVIWES